MAIVLDKSRDTFDVILSIDSALDCSEEQFKTYQETLDESLLTFKPGMQPTRFVMQKVLPFGLAKRIQNEQVTVNSEGKPVVGLGFIFEEVKASLVGIKNPIDTPEDQCIVFEKDKDGTASTSLMELLASANLIQELYSARQTRMRAGNEQLKKK